MKLKTIVFGLVLTAISAIVIYALAGHMDKTKTEETVGETSSSQRLSLFFSEGPYEIFIPAGYPFMGRSPSENDTPAFTVAPEIPIPDPNCRLKNLPWLPYEKSYKTNFQHHPSKKYNSYVKTTKGTVFIFGETLVKGNEVAFWAGRNLPDFFLEPNATDLLLEACIKQGNQNIWKQAQDIQ